MTKITRSGSWLEHMLAGDYRAKDIADAPTEPGYAIDGLLPATGASMWFGAGAVGKTQLLLWMAAHLACPGPDAPTTWLGRTIRRRGHILVLSAEDLREHLLGRLKSITSLMTDQTGAPIDAQTVCDRIHLLPFLSLDRPEFAEVSPSLFGGSGAWTPTRLLLDVEDVIDRWNRAHGEDERIVGVVMDSAVTMAGFDLTSADATTRFLFHLNRRSRGQDVFWAIIGHTPKHVTIDRDDPQSGAVGRLRGAAMWSTSPRAIIEVRTAGSDDTVAAVRKLRPGTSPRDVVQLGLVKANLKGADHRLRTLVRNPEGAFEDLSDDMPDAPAPLSKRSTPLTTVEAVVAVIREITGAVPGSAFTRADLAIAVSERQAKSPVLASLDLTFEGAKAADHNLAGILKLLAAAGLIGNGRKGPCKVIDLDRTPVLPPRGT